jgi:hypothetical protein
MTRRFEDLRLCVDSGLRGDGGNPAKEATMSSRARHGHRFEQLLRFEPCADCTFDFATGEGERSCHYGTCPNLPDALDVRCPQCYYNFVTRDTVPACGESPSCDFALEEAPERVRNLTAWRAHHDLPPLPV